LDFDEVSNRVLMKAVLKTWEDIAVTYSFKITNEPLPPGSPALAKRDGKTLSLAHDFSRQLFNVNTKGLDIGVSCSPCGIEGSVNIDLDLETAFGIPVGASMKITPRNIAAAIELSLQLDGELASAYSPDDVNVVSVPLTGFNVGGFFKLGVFLTVVRISCSKSIANEATLADLLCRISDSRLMNGQGQRRLLWGRECLFRIRLP
jgi:hypothetical protein